MSRFFSPAVLNVMRTTLAAVLLLAGCTDLSTHANVLSKLQAPDGGSSDDAGTCIPSSSSDEWPVKVLLIVEQSGRMCVLDAPGSQGSAGICEMDEAFIATFGALPTEPSRVRAIKALTDGFQNQPTVEVALEPFETNAVLRFPVSNGFARPNLQLVDVVDTLQSTLGRAADTQGALELAKQIIELDIAQTANTDPALLPRTKYVVLLISSGVPMPRCSSNDTLGSYADATHPDGIWADEPLHDGGWVDPDCIGYDCGAPTELGPDGGQLPPENFCNDIDPYAPNGMVGVNGFIPGSDRNQNQQLTDLVDGIVALRNMPDAGVGDVRVHTALLYDQQTFDVCAGFCSGMFLPNDGDAMRGAATWLLQQLALHGQGTFHDLGSPPAADLSWLDTAPFTTFCP